MSSFDLFGNPIEDESLDGAPVVPTGGSTSPWGEGVLASVENAEPFDTEEFWGQVEDHDPEEAVPGFDREGNALDGSQPNREDAPPGPDGYQVPTDESLNTALDDTFSGLGDRIRGNPTFGNLEWEDPSPPKDTARGLSEELAADFVPVDYEIPERGSEEEYGWGVKNAFMRGLLRAGQLVDLAQNDWEEYAEGEESLQKYATSEEDNVRLAELQESEGFWDALGYYITNPALAMQVVAESLPMSAPTLAGGAVGAVLGGPAGAMAGGGAGSFTTEYLASVSEAMTAEGVDATDPAQLRAAYNNDELMADARERAAKRGLGVAMFDALSMGLAGRIYKPVKALTGTATKAGAVLGGTSEIIAQASAGAAGEASAQLLAGDEYDPVAIAGEAIGEIVPGIGEAAIGKIGGTPAERDTPDPTPDTTPIPEFTPPDVAQAKLDAEAEGVDVDAEGEDIVVTPPPPEPETATPSENTETKAPSAQEETSSEVVEETDVDDMLAAAAEKEEAADVAEGKAKEEAVTPEEVSPLIDTKSLGPKVTGTITSNEKPGPVRAAWRGLMETLAKRYPETAAKVPSRTFSGTGVAKFFKQLQDDVDLTTDLPDLKTFLDEVATGKPAEVIQVLDRITSHVQGTIPSLTDAPIESVAGQVQAEYNNFMAYFEKAKTVGKGKLTKGKEVLKGTKIKMANQLGELSGAVRTLLLAAEKAGVLEEAGIGADYGKTMDLADQIADTAQSPLEKKTAAGGKSKTIGFGSSTLLNVANNLKEIAEKVTPLLAEAETKAKEAKPAVDTTITTVSSIEAKQPDATAKVEETSAVTEAPAKPMGRQIVDASRIADLKEAIRKLSTGTQNARSKKLIAAKQKLIKEIEAGTDNKAPQASKAKKTSKAKGMDVKTMLEPSTDTRSYNDLRKAAKALGIKTTGKKAELLARVVTEETNPTPKAKPKPKVKVKKSRQRKPDVKDAKPDEVFDPPPRVRRGRDAADKAAIVGEEGPGAFRRALAKIGVSNTANDKLQGILDAVDDTAKEKITAAGYEYMKSKDLTRFVAQVSDAVGGQTVSVGTIEALTEFALAINDRAEARAASSDAMDVIHDDNLDMTEDERAIAEMTGAIEPRIDDQSTTVDEHNVPWAERLKKMVEPNPNMTPAQRTRFKLDQSMISRAINKIIVELQSVTHSSLLESQGLTPGKINMQELIDLLLTVMPENHRFTHLLKMLKTTGLQMEVQLFDTEFSIDPSGTVGGTFSVGKNADGTVDPESSVIKAVFSPEDRSEVSFVRTLLHEMLHAATAVRYHADRAFKKHMNALWMQSLEAFTKVNPSFPLDKVKQLIEQDGHQAATDLILDHLLENEGQQSKYYGLANPLEFISESFTNNYFQEFLAGTDVQAHPDMLPPIRRAIRSTAMKLKSLMDIFLRGIGDFLGVSVRNSILEEVILSSTANFDSRISHAFAKGNFRVDSKPLPSKVEAKAKTTIVNDTADAARDRDSKLKQTLETLADTLKSLPRAINLGFMNRDVIERNYRDLFARAAKAAGHVISPLTQYIKAKQASSRLAEKFAVRATAALQRMQKLDAKTRAKLQTMMRETTLAEVWPHLSLRNKMNAHLWGKPDKNGVSKLSPTLGVAAKQARREWVALNKKNPEAAQLLIDMAMLTKEIQDQKRIEALRTVGKTYELDPNTIKKLALLETREDIQNMFPGMYDKEGNLVDMDDTSVRPADTVIDKKDSKDVKEAKKKKLAEWRDARAVVKTAEQIVKGTSINGPYFPLRRYGKYVVSSTDEHNEDGEQYVSFHHTRKEAKRVAAAIEKAHGIPTYVTKKIESMSIPRDVESVTAELTSRMGRRKDGVSDHMSKRLQTAMLEIMADNTAYASQLKRHGVDGVAADDMGRAFEEYVFVAKYTLGDLATSYEVHQALKDLKNLQSKGMQDAIRQDGVTEEEALLVGDVVNELAAQNREDAKDREMSKFQKGVGLIGFFNFLGAPSYWVLNATQTLTVTLPYIGSKWGAKGTAAYTQSAKTIFKAMAAAIKSGDKSYEGFKAKLPPAAQKVVAALEAEGIIQSTIAHQFGDIMTPSTLTSIQDWAGPVGKATATALKLMETIPEGVEKYNRISTALAIYNLSDGDITAVADGVQATQFNYDSANRARLLKAAPGWAGGGLRAVITPMMMFKSYGIGLSRLLYGSMMDVALKKGKDRTEAMKLAGGLIVSHSVFGGVAGGIMIAPVQAMVWAFNESFREVGDEFDPKEAVELYLQDVANDTVAALVARGLPAAAGLEMSKSINLGNLIWMGNDRINLSDAGGVETMMTTALGPVAQYAITTVREGSRLWSGDPRGNWYDFAAAAIPLKMARGTIRGLKYEMEGIGTDTLTFVDPDDVTGWLRSAMGFRPTNVAMTTDFEYNIMAREARVSRRKSQLTDRALRADTAAERAAVWKEIQDFNRSLESRGDYIRRGDMVRLRSRRRSRQRQHDRERR